MSGAGVAVPETRPLPVVVAQFLAEAHAAQLIFSAPSVVTVAGPPTAALGSTNSARELAALARAHPVRLVSRNRFLAVVSDPGDVDARGVALYCHRVDGLLPWQATADVLLDWDAELAAGTLDSSGRPAREVAQLAGSLAGLLRVPPARCLADVLRMDLHVELDRGLPRGPQARVVLREAANLEIGARILPGEFGTVPAYSDAVDLAARLLMDAYGSFEAKQPLHPADPASHEEHALAAFESLGVLETARAEARLSARQVLRPRDPVAAAPPDRSGDRAAGRR